MHRIHFDSATLDILKWYFFCCGEHFKKKKKCLSIKKMKSTFYNMYPKLYKILKYSHFLKYPGSFILSQLSASMGSSFKQLHQNYSNIAKSCNVPISSVTKKWQLPDQWSDHHSKGAERTAHGIARKASQNPYLTTKDLQVGLTDWSCGTMFNCWVTPAQGRPSWKSHQKETSPLFSLQNSASELGKRTSQQVSCILETKSCKQVRLRQKLLAKMSRCRADIWRRNGTEFSWREHLSNC